MKRNGFGRICLIVVVVLSLSALAGRVVAQELSPAPPAAVDWIDILQNVITLIITVAIPPLAAWAVSEITQALNRIKVDHQWKHVYWAVQNAVEAAEQLGLTGQLMQFGENKLDVALRFLEAELAVAGVPLDVHEHALLIRALIEAEVRRKFPGDDPTEEDGDGDQIVICSDAV